jgi:hypothetical protein
MVKRGANHLSPEILDPKKAKSTQPIVGHKMDLSVAELFPILIYDGGQMYKEKPKLLKNDLDSYYVDVKIKEAKITSKGHLIINFEEITDYENFIKKKRCEIQR